MLMLLFHCPIIFHLLDVITKSYRSKIEPLHNKLQEKERIDLLKEDDIYSSTVVIKVVILRRVGGCSTKLTYESLLKAK